MASALLTQGKADQLLSEFGNTTLSTRAADAELKTQLGDANLRLSRIEEAERVFAEVLAAQPDYVPARVRQARVLRLKGKIADAEHIVDEILAASPEETEALSLKADLVFQQGKADEGIAYLKQVVQLKPRDVASVFSLALALLELGRLDEVSLQIESIRKLAANDPRTIFLQALMALRQGKLPLSRDLALQVLKVAPEHLPSLLVAATANYQLGAQLQAQNYLRSALKLAPRSLVATRLLVSSYLQTGDTTLASQMLDKARGYAPNEPTLLILAADIALAKKDLPVAEKYFQQAEKYGASAGAVDLRLAQIKFAAGAPEQALQLLAEGSAADDEHYQSDLALVLYYARNGQMDKALSWIASIEKKQPQAPVVPTLRGMLYLQNKDYAGSRKQFDAALALRPDLVAAIEGLALVDTLEKKPDDARKRFEEALRKSPGNERLALGYVRFLRSSGTPIGDCIAVLQRTIEARPDAMQARAALISAFAELKQTQQALTAAQQALAISPDDVKLLQLAGQVQILAGQANQAVSTFERVATLAAQAPGPLVMLANAHLANGDKVKALATLKRAVELKPNFLPAQTGMIAIYLADGHTDQALSVARTMQRQRPKEQIGYQVEARVLAAAQRWKEAVAVLENALRVTTPSPSLVSDLHAAFVKLGRQSEADGLAAQWLNDHPNDVELRSYLAQRALMEKDYKSAVRLYKEILSIRSDAPIALNNLAWAAGQLDDPKAIEFAEQANTLLPNSPQILDTLGWLLVQKGDLTRGIKLLRQASADVPTQLAIRLNLAKALIRADQKDAARKELESVISSAKNADTKAEAEALLREL